MRGMAAMMNAMGSMDPTATKNGENPNDEVSPEELSKLMKDLMQSQFQSEDSPKSQAKPATETP